MNEYAQEVISLIHAALSLLRRDTVSNADMIYPLQRGQTDILKADEDGVLFIDKVSRICFAALPDTEGSVSKLMAVTGVNGFAIHGAALAERFSRLVRMDVSIPYVTSVYTGKTAPSVPRVCSVKTLTEETMEEMLSLIPVKNPALLRAYAKEGLLRGATIKDEPVGFISLLPQGGMGMLHVREGFRRRGIGEVLEAQCIKELLSKGITPYGLVPEQDAPARDMSAQLGCETGETPIIMLYRKDI